MPISETKICTRPDVDTPHFVDTEHPLKASLAAVYQPYKDAGTYTLNQSDSEDGLTRTRVETFANLEVYTALDTALSIKLDCAYKKYYSDLNSLYTELNQYQQTGINQPFKCTTTFTFPESSTEMSQWVLDAINNDGKGRLVNVSVTPTSIVAVHQYLNSADFTANRFTDFNYCQEMDDAGFLRQISYELV